MGCKMVTFALVSDNKKQATYHYFPEGKENNDYGIIKLDKKNIEYEKSAENRNNGFEEMNKCERQLNSKISRQRFYM